MKVLYITPVPYEGAGSRYRIYQYLGYLSEKGIGYSVSPFLFSAFFKIVYKKGMVLRKTLFFILGFFRRLFDLVRAFNYDVIVIYRESFPFGPPFFEYILHLFKKKIIFDFDDAIFLPNVSDANRMIRRLRRFNNVKDIIQMSSAVFAVNKYLIDYTLNFTPRVYFVPTVIDTDRLVPPVNRDTEKIIIGWVGTFSTQNYIFGLREVFKTLLGNYPQVEIRIIGAQKDFLRMQGIVYKDWSLEEEVINIQRFSIGIMPLPDNDWVRGKGGFKTLQYMACGVTAVVSNVGTNKDLIKDRVNGFLVDTTKDWLERLSFLIENPDLCKKIGLEGRKFVEEEYSLKKYGPEYTNHIIRVLNEK